VARGQGTAKDQYELMTDKEIYAMPVGQLAKSDSVLLLWGTWPKLPEALQTMQAWGFEYVTGFPWIKLNKNGHGVYYGVGYWVRGCSEFVFIGKRGDVSAPRMEGFLGLMSPNFQHSRKPDSIHELAQALPGPYLELFARRSMPGWTSFGNEVEDIKTGLVLRPANKGIKPTPQPRLL
jgi:N6-adenosine-specific RNA methylase IME4